MNIFKFVSYYKYLRSIIDSSSDMITIAKIAEIAGVQRSYLSNVLANRANLSRDQAFLVSQFLQHNELEQKYFLELVELERAGSSTYKNHLKKIIDEMRSKALTVSETTTRKKLNLDETVLTEYFMSWEYTAIHILTSIPRFKNLSAIAKELELSEDYTLKILNKLESWGMISKKDNQYTWLSGDIHVPQNSPLVSFHHRNWREKAIESSIRQKENPVHFTSVYSISKSDFEKFKAEVLEMVKIYNNQASQSKEETLVVLNLDFFCIGS